MKPIIKNILAVVAGWLLGSIINMGLVTLGHSLFPIEGIDPNNMEEFSEVVGSLEMKYFIFPFLAHAFGTLTGAMIAALIAAGNKMQFAMVVGVIFLIGGIVASILLPAPLWFTATDLILAYIPMAWFGWKIIDRKKD